MRVLATAWEKHGDHPQVTPFKSLDHPCYALCRECGERFADHGGIDYGHMITKVCPGMVVIELPISVARDRPPFEGEIHVTPRPVFDQFYEKR